MNRCLVLGVDPAARSGWALRGPAAPLAGRKPSPESTGLLAHGTTTRSRKGARATVEAVRLASDLAHSFGVPLVVVGERWVGDWSAEHGGTNTRTIAGLGASWGRWEAVLDLEGVVRRRVLRVDQPEWRRAIHGAPARRRSESWKRAAIQWCRLRHGVELDADTAEAVCIAEWAMLSPKVAEVLR